MSISRTDSGKQHGSQGGKKGAEKRSEGSRLGNRREYFHPGGGGETPSKAESAKKLRRETLADARQAAKIFRSYEKIAKQDGGDASKLAGRGVCFCGWHQIKGVESKVMRVQKPERIHAYATGQQMCGLRWLCPICTAQQAEEDRKFVNDGLAAAREAEGVWPVMLTLTTRHSRYERGADILQGIMRAEQKLKRLKAWQRLSASSVGYVRVLEWTFGEHGHHPHFHTIILMRAESEEAAIAEVEKIKPAYMGQLDRAGRDGKSAAAWKHSFQVQGAAGAQSYITKWGSAEEITGAHKKEAKGEGFTSWQLLRRSRTLSDDEEREEAAAVWWEIIQATKGKSQLYKSQGFKELVEEWRAGQDESEPAPEPEEVVNLGVRTGHFNTSRFDQYRVKTLEVREAAEKYADLVVAQSAVECALLIGDRDDEILERMAPDDDPGDLIDDTDDGLDGQAGSTELLRPEIKLNNSETGGGTTGRYEDFQSSALSSSPKYVEKPPPEIAM